MSSSVVELLNGRLLYVLPVVLIFFAYWNLIALFYTLYWTPDAGLMQYK